MKIVDEDPDEDMWVEKNIDMDGEHVSSLSSIYLSNELMVFTNIAARRRHPYR